MKENMKLNMSEDRLRELAKIEDESDVTCCNPNFLETCVFCGNSFSRFGLRRDEFIDGSDAIGHASVRFVI